MRTSFLGLVGLGLAMAPAGALAQWMPGSELTGQSVQVETNGVMNMIHFDPGGAARIVTPQGSVVQGTWSSGPGGLCLNASGGQECWSYATPLNAGQPMMLTSSCNAMSTWTAMNTNVPPPPPPQQPSAMGERG